VNAAPHPDLVIVPAWEDVIELCIAEEPPPEDQRWEWALSRLRNEPLVYMTRRSFEGIVDRLAASNWLGPRRIPCGDLELTKSLTIAGVGVGVLPRRVARYGAGDGIRQLHPKLPRFEDTIHLVYRADVHRTRGHHILKDALLAHARALEPL
jgi:DNA-binding transcriptional LysR family regulator